MTNLAGLIDRHPADAVALVDGDRRIGYGELRDTVARVRGGLTAAGVAPGDRVALLLGNSADFVVAYLAVLGVGAVAVPLNPLSPAAEIDAELAAVGAGVVLRAGEALPSADPVAAVDRADDEPAALLFTSGTAGTPRAAILTHGNLRSNLEQVQRHPGRTVVAGDVALGVLPFFHVFGLNVLLGLALHSGSSVVLVDHFEPALALDLVERQGVTMLAGAPPMFAALTAAGAERRSALASVRLAASGAAPLPVTVATEFEAVFGVPLHQGYGLTEASPVVTSPLVDERPRPGSVGVPLPGVEVRLVDEDGETALGGDPGEVWVRGPNVFAGYWEDPDATARALEDGWLRTGDIGVTDDEGHLFLVDRVKDLVIVSGFNVFPAEVETVLSTHPDVEDAAVVGVPDARTGEAVHAFVVARAGAVLDPTAVMDHARSKLARYKCPTQVHVVDVIPHGQAGKLLRRQLREG